MFSTLIYVRIFILQIYFVCVDPAYRSQQQDNLKYTDSLSVP